MKAALIKKIDALSQALRAEGYEVKTTISFSHDTLFITAKHLSDQDIKQLRQASPEIRIAEGG